MKVSPFISFSMLLVIIALECVRPLDAYLMRDNIYSNLRFKPGTSRKYEQCIVFSMLQDEDLNHRGMIDINEKIDESWNMSNGHAVSIPSSTILNLSGHDAILKFNSHLCIEGILMGAELRCNKSSNTYVAIEKGGELHADVLCAENVIINGRLVGNVNCKRLQVSSSAEIIGDVTVEKMSLEEGGTILGIMRCGKNSSPKWMNNSVKEGIINHPNEGLSFLGDKNGKHNLFFFENQIKIIPLKSTQININGETSRVVTQDRDKESVTDFLGTDYKLCSNMVLSDQPHHESYVEPKKNKEDAIPSAIIKCRSHGKPSVFEDKWKHPSLSKEDSTSESKQNKIMLDLKEEVKQVSNEGIISSNSKKGKSVEDGLRTQQERKYKRSKSLLTENMEKSKSNQLLKKSEKFVDDFGNPLLRGAGHDQVVSFRECRSMCKETRDLLDHTKKSKLKPNVEILGKLCASSRTHSFLAKALDNSKQTTCGQMEGSQNPTVNSSVNKKQQNGSRNDIKNHVTEVRHDVMDHDMVHYIRRNKKHDGSNGFIPPFLSQ